MVMQIKLIVVVVVIPLSRISLGLTLRDLPYFSFITNTNSFFLLGFVFVYFFVDHALCPSVRTDQISPTALNDEGAAISGHWPQSLCLKYTLSLHLT